jgi:hypothetical protein
MMGLWWFMAWMLAGRLLSFLDYLVITREANSEWNHQSSLRLLRLQYIYEILWVCEQFQQITFRNIVNARNATVEWTDLHNGLSQEDQHFFDAYGLATWACALHVQPMHIYDLWFIYALWSNNVAVAMSLATLDPCFTAISIRFVWSAVNQNWLELNMQIHIFSSIWSANVGPQTSILDSSLGHVGTHPSSVSLWTVESGLPSTLHFCPHAADFVGVKHYFQVNDQDLRSIYSHHCTLHSLDALWARSFIAHQAASSNSKIKCTSAPPWFCLSV